jgi:thiol:disulfide interchange protein
VTYRLTGLLFAVLSLAVWPLSAKASDSDPATFSVTVTPIAVHRGEIESVVIEATIDPGWHLYGLVPTPQPGPSPTSITVTATGLTIVGPASESRPISAYDPNFEKNVSYHEQSATFTVPVRVDLPIGTSNAAVNVSYQTCNSSICLPPRTKTFTCLITTVAGDVRPQFEKISLPPPDSRSLLLFLLAAFGAGLLSLFTPCVFPMIPITLTSFVKQADGDKRRLVQLSLGYSLGIVVLYVGVGAITAVVVGAGGVDRLAANPYINLFAFAVFVVFALSFFETIQISVPGNLSALQIAARKQGGWISLTLLGIVFVFASFTCTAPFIGTLLVTAAGGNLGKPLAGMVVFAFAFVSPFVIFSFFPQWIAKIPKSGIWLARIKATLGFIELGASLKFLSNVDLVWQWKILTQPVLLASWAVLALCASFYLLGLLQFGVAAETEPYGTKVSVSRIAFSLLFMAVTAYCFWGLTGRPINPIVASFLPPPGYGGADTGVVQGLPWLTDYATALAAAKAQSKPLLIDFTGYTCTNCRLNEKQIFPDPGVQEELSKFVRVQLYTDGGVNASENERLQLSKFGDVALPLYGIIDPSSVSVTAKTAGVQSVAEFEAFLNSNSGHLNAPAPSLWQPFSDDAMADAVTEGKPTIIDCTANWCVNCKAIERTVFTDPNIASQFAHFVTLRDDMTNFTSPSSLSLEKKYSIDALPTIIFIGRNGAEVPGTRVKGLITAADFRARMDRARL